MAYIIINSSGNRCGVSEEKYKELIQKEGYTGEVIDDKPSEYPIDKGAGWFELSDGSSVRGEKKAMKAQKELE